MAFKRQNRTAVYGAQPPFAFVAPVRAEDGGEANPSMSPARSAAGLLLYFPASLPRHPRLNPTAVIETPPSAIRRPVLGFVSHPCRQGRGRAGGRAPMRCREAQGP